MKTKTIIGMMLMLMALVGMSSCSSDDEVDSGLMTSEGTWNMVKASYGFGGVQEYQAGEVTISFNDKSLIVKNNKGINFLKSGTYPYKTETEQRRILTYEWVDVEYHVIVIDYTDEAWGNREVKYTYEYRDGMLVLDGGSASDGPCYYFRKP